MLNDDEGKIILQEQPRVKSDTVPLDKLLKLE